MSVPQAFEGADGAGSLNALFFKFSSTFFKRSRWDCKGRAAPYDLFSSPFLFVSFFFAALSAKEKAESGLGGLYP